MDREEKYKRNMRCLDKWMTNQEAGKWFNEYLKFLNIKRIGIYGYGMLGRHLVRELKSRDCNINWIMDKVAIGDDISGNIIRPDEASCLKDVDMAIITSLTNVEEIELHLLDFVTGQVIALDELIDMIYVWSGQN